MAGVIVCGMGRMGKHVVKQLVEGGHNVVAAVDTSGNPAMGKDAGEYAGVNRINVKVENASDLEGILKKTKPDVAVDFSTPAACVRNMTLCAEAGLDLVIGTTGFSAKQFQALEHVIAENKVGAVISSNMSVGINIFWKLAISAAQKMKHADIEIIEAHHNQKKDAPSGTALTTAEKICKAIGKSPENNLVYGRRGVAPRRAGEIAIHAIRAGDIVGEHTVLFATPGERIEIKHVAQSREAFAGGVVSAVEFITGKKGVYSMGDVLRM